MNNSNTSLGKWLSSIEKEWFPWGKNRLVSGQPAFFPGCNLVNFLPATAKKTIDVFREQNCGWLYDCCGKPLKMAGNQAAANRVLSRIKRRLKDAGVTELIVACPNCYSVFQKELDLPVKDIYTFLKERSVPCTIADDILQTFPPCPDRKTGVIRQAISHWADAEMIEATDLPCCGLGISNPQKARNARDKILADQRILSPYCASCYGHLRKSGVQIRAHILTQGLGLTEEAATGIKQGINRMRPLLWK